MNINDRIRTLLAPIQLTAPASGEAWQTGTIHNITWTSTGISGNVAIHLFKGPVNAGPCQDGIGDCYVTTLSDNIIPASTGSFSWNIPTSLVASNEYHIKIESSLDPNQWNSDGWTTRRFELTGEVVCNVPASNFTYSVSGVDVQFTDSSTNSPTSWSWDFGDNTTSTLQNPSHTYTTSGNKSVTLIATNSCGAGTPTVKTVSISSVTTENNYSTLAKIIAVGAGIYIVYRLTKKGKT